jgi:regulator of replication initiation timing
MINFFPVNLEISRSLALTDDSLISIQLQISHHYQKIKNLRERHHQKDSKMPTVSRVLESNKPSARPSPLYPEGKTDCPKTTHPEKSTTSAKSDLESLIRIEILKGDRLLDHLVSHQLDQKSDEEAQSSAERQKNDMISSAVKLPKSTEQVLEELQCHNSQLKTLMGSLFIELEALKLENGVLKEKLGEFERQSALKDASQEVAPPSSSILPLADLPPLAPLEMPEMSTFHVKPRVKVPARKNTLSE